MLIFFKLANVATIFLMISSMSYGSNYEIFTESGKVGLKDDAGKVLIPPLYDDLGWSNQFKEPKNGVIGFRSNNLWGLVSLEHKKIVSATYHNLFPFNNQLLVASRKGKIAHVEYYGLINSAGKIAVPFRYFSIEPGIGNAIVTKKEGTKIKYGLIGLDGSELVPLVYKSVQITGDSFVVQNFKDKLAIYQSKGIPSSEFIYEQIEELDQRYTLVKKNNAYGLYLNQKLRLPATYKRIFMVNGEVYAQPFDKWEVINDDNEKVRSYYYDHIQPLGQNYLVRSNESEWVIDSAEIALTNLTNEKLIVQGRRFIAFKRNRFWGLINSDFEIVIKAVHDSIRMDSGLVFAQDVYKKWFVYDTLGVKKSNYLYQEIREKTGYYWPVKRKDHWGFIDQSGEEVIAPVYDYVSKFVSGQTVVGFHGQQGIINKSGDWEVLPTSGNLQLLNSDLYLVKSGTLTTLKSSSKGTIYFTENPIEIKDNYLLEHLSDGRIWKIDFTGQIKNNQPRNEHFQEIRNPSEGLYPVKIDGLYGFIDHQNRLIVSNRYEDVGNFVDGLAPFKLMGKWGFINRKEKIIVQPLYSQVSDFINNVAIVVKDGRHYLMDKKGKRLHGTGFDHLSKISPDLYLTKTDGRLGLMNSKGRLLVNSRYQALEYLNNGYIVIQKNGNYGLITDHGVDIIPAVYDQLKYNPVRNEYLVMKKSTAQKVALR
ncbi:MAG: WG repeat-containing protein [Bacteroidota bacterium]